MSLNAIYQIILYLGKFKNIQLRDQGHYMMTSTISTHLETEQIFAKPYHFFQSNKQLNSRKKHKVSKDPNLTNIQYQTKQFRIKYSDQEINLEETVVFRLELPTYPKIPFVTLNIELYFVQSEKEDLIDEASFRLNIGEMPIKCYSDINFRRYKSKGTFCVFSMMIDYKFRSYHGAKDTQSNKKRAKITSLEQYFQFYKEQTKKSTSGIYKDYIKSLRAYCQNAKIQWSKLIIGNQLQYKLTVPKYYLQEEQDSQQLPEITLKSYYQYLKIYDLQTSDSKFFQQDVQNICTESYAYMQLFLQKMAEGKLNIIELKKRYEAAIKDRYSQFILRNNISSDQIICDKFKGKEKQTLAGVFRKNKQYGKQAINYQVIDLNQKDMEDKPLLFHELTPQRKGSQDDVQVFSRDLLVFCHGMGGKAIDMIPIKNFLKKLCPHGLCLIIKSNENKTDGSILSMGQKTALEITQYIYSLRLQKHVTIHFIGHSLGGIILRSAIPYLSHFKDRFGIFMSFSTPHLSYLRQTSSSILAGMWFLKKIRKTVVLNQLTMSDHTDFKQTFLYKLSLAGSLKNFRKVVLVSSFQDKYVPWHSARIHQSQKCNGDKFVQLQNQMSKNILQGGGIQQIHRIEVSLSIAETSFDSLIGRAAHIRLLSDQSILNMVGHCIQGIFG